MKSWQVVTVFMSFAYLPWAAGADRGVAAAPRCRPGLKTSFAAHACVNVWPATDAKFRWPDLQSKCDPASPVCDSAKASVTQTLALADCEQVQILSLLPNEHLARIRCGDRRIPSQELLINLDSLSCHPGNVLNYGRFPDLDGEPQGEADGRELKGAQAAGVSEQVGETIVKRAEYRMREMSESVASDTRTILDAIHQVPAPLFFERLATAELELNQLLVRVRAHRKLDPVCEPLYPRLSMSDDAIRAQRTCRLLHAALVFAQQARTTAQKMAQAMPGTHSAFWEKIALQKTVARSSAARDAYEQGRALSARMLVFYALKNADTTLPARLHLIRRAVEAGPAFWELHAGFVFGGRRLQANSGGGYDCSDFMASLLVGRGKATEQVSTWSLKSIARHLQGEYPRKYLSSSVRSLVSCFANVDVRHGERPQPGDFVVSNSEALKDGHVAIVKSLVDDHAILTIEASGGGANTIMSKVRPLFEPQPSCESPERRMPMRPDLYVLRLKAARSASCPLSVAALSVR